MPQNRVQGSREWIAVRAYKATELESMVMYGRWIQVLKARMVELWGEEYVVSRVEREVVRVQKRKRPVGLQQGADCIMQLEVIY